MKIREITTQKILSPTQINLADYVINPYRGCEFGCLYCYSQSNKNIKRDGFKSSLGIKINAPRALEKELHFVKPKRVLLASTTECFQYREENYHITKEILFILNKHNIPYTILTKSHLIAHYLWLISKNEENKIYFTFNFSSDKIIKTLEEKSPTVQQRLKTIRAIIDNKINLRIHIGPYIPYLSNLEEILNLLPKGIKEVDVELYHKKQGNFDNLLKAIEEGFNKELGEKIKDVYRNQESYERFSDKLKLKVEGNTKQLPFSFYYIVPGYNEFYSPTIDYKNTLIKAP